MHIIVPENIPYYCFCTLANIFLLHGILVNMHLTFKKFNQLSQLACNCPSFSRTLLVLALKVQHPWNTLHPKQTRIVRSTFRTKPNDLHSFSALSAHSLECTLELVTLQNCFTTECLKPTVSATILKNTIPFTLLYTKIKKISYQLTPSLYQVFFVPHTNLYSAFLPPGLCTRGLTDILSQPVSIPCNSDFGWIQSMSLRHEIRGWQENEMRNLFCLFSYQRPYSIFSHVLQ